MNTTPFRGWFTRLAVRSPISISIPASIQFDNSIFGHSLPSVAPTAFSKSNHATLSTKRGDGSGKFSAVGSLTGGAGQDVVGLARGCRQLGASDNAHRRSDYSYSFLNLFRLTGQTGVRRQNRVVAGNP